MGRYSVNHEAFIACNRAQAPVGVQKVSRSVKRFAIDFHDFLGEKGPDHIS